MNSTPLNIPVFDLLLYCLEMYKDFPLGDDTVSSLVSKVPIIADTRESGLVYYLLLPWNYQLGHSWMVSPWIVLVTFLFTLSSHFFSVFPVKLYTK